MNTNIAQIMSTERVKQIISLSKFLKPVFHKFCLVHSWIPWPICSETLLLSNICCILLFNRNAFRIFVFRVNVKYFLFLFCSFSENTFPLHCFYNKIQAQVLRIFVRFKLGYVNTQQPYTVWKVPFTGYYILRTWNNMSKYEDIQNMQETLNGHFCAVEN